jgi:hypothetical protein
VTRSAGLGSGSGSSSNSYRALTAGAGGGGCPLLRGLKVPERFTDLHHSLRQNTALKATDAIAQVLQA